MIKISAWFRITLIFILFPTYSYSQKFSSIPVYRDFYNSEYLRVNYENDVFYNSDHGYTQGIGIEIVNKFFEKNPLNFLFWKNNSGDKYGLSIEHLTFTPSTIGNDKIQYGDQPFAAALYFKSFNIAKDHNSNYRIYSSLSFGVLGPLALGKDGQTFIHKLIDNLEPVGWKNQIANDIILNYEISYEKQLISINNNLQINYDSGIRIGTLYTDLSLGFSGMMGFFNSPFSILTNKNKIQVYLFGNPRLYIIGYDASLQGGIFNKDSPYVLNSFSIERLKTRLNIGFILKSGKFYFEYSRTQISKEYYNGSSETWGGIKLGYKI